MHILFYVIGTGLVAAGLIMGVFTLSSGIVFRDPGTAAFVVIPLVAGFIFIFGTSSRQKMMATYREQNFEWFKQNHPECVTDHGVKCSNCGGTKIGIQKLMRKTFMRSHSCVTCGHNLYYSAE